MTAYSKAAKRKRRKITRPDDNGMGLAPTPRRQPNGQLARPADNAQLNSLRTRAAQNGLTATDASLRDMRAPWWGCQAGKAMAATITSNDDRLALWDAIQHMRRVIIAYDMAIGAPSRHAKCLAILAPTPAMEADAESPPIDDRDEAERQRHAVSALMKLESWLGYTDSAAAGQAKRAVWDDCEVYDAKAMIRALWCVSDGIRGAIMIYRRK